MPPATVNLFDRTLEGPVGIAAGPLPNAKWIAAYARLGYGLLTYSTVRSREYPASRAPNLAFCRLGDPTTIEPAPRRLDPAAVTLAYSFGLPSATPDVWRADVKRARAALGPKQLLVVSVVGTPAPDGDGEQLAADYAACARWAAEAGADVVEVHLSAPDTAGERAQMVYEDVALSAHIVQRVRRAVGLKPVVAKVGAARSPRALHDLATATARWLDGFTLINGLQRRLVNPDGAPALTGPGRELAGVSGAAVWEHGRVQVAELTDLLGRCGRRVQESDAAFRPPSREELLRRAAARISEKKKSELAAVGIALEEKDELKVEDSPPRRIR